MLLSSIVSRSEWSAVRWLALFRCVYAYLDLLCWRCIDLSGGRNKFVCARQGVMGCAHKTHTEQQRQKQELPMPSEPASLVLSPARFRATALWCKLKLMCTVVFARPLVLALYLICGVTSGRQGF